MSEKHIKNENTKPKLTHEKEKFSEVLQRATELGKQCRELIAKL